MNSPADMRERRDREEEEKRKKEREERERKRRDRYVSLFLKCVTSKLISAAVLRRFTPQCIIIYLSFDILVLWALRLSLVMSLLNRSGVEETGFARLREPEEEEEDDERPRRGRCGFMSLTVGNQSLYCRWNRNSFLIIISYSIIARLSAVFHLLFMYRWWRGSHCPTSITRAWWRTKLTSDAQQSRQLCWYWQFHRSKDYGQVWF